jgi:hypothetical protein
VGVGPVPSDEVAAPIEDRLRVTRNDDHRWRGTSPESSTMTARSVQVKRGRATLRRTTVSWHESEGAVSQAVEQGKDHGESASSSGLLLVKPVAGSSRTLQARGSRAERRLLGPTK